MDISLGFEIEDPKVFIPWRISEGELKEILGESLRYITKGYYTVTCVSLNGMKHELGFHFKPRYFGKLFELEFFRRSYPDQKVSFEEFQKHFEGAFGTPSVTNRGEEGFPNYLWRLKNVEIVHYVFNRFGPEEHMRIRFK